MAYNLPPPGDDGPGGPGGFGGPGGPGFGFGGFPFGGFGKSFNFDVGAGAGFPGFFGGGIPGWGGGFGGPYVPVTPLGGLWGFKGDLIVPIVAIGVAIFIFILVVLAVKYALAWKLEILDSLAGGKKLLRREAGSAPAEHLEDNNLNRLADVVSAAIYSEGCSKRILCEIGSYAREGQQYPSLIRLVELLVPETYHESFVIMRDASEAPMDCASKYPCGGNPNQSQSVSENEIDVNGTQAGGNGAKLAAGGAANQTGSASATGAPTTPAPTMFGKFKRAVLS